MNLQTAKVKNPCPSSEIAAYIDGELKPRAEIILEKHLAECADCAAELNEQKRFLCALDFSLENEREIELPANFTRVIVANAESSVGGLRHPKERFNALFVCAALFLLTVLGLGSETESVVNSFINFGEQVFAVTGFLVHFVYDIGFGATVILRFLSYQFVHNSLAAYAFLPIFAIASLIAFSHFKVLFNRA